MLLEGKCFKFGDDLNTDYIIPAKYRGKYGKLDDMLPHIMEDLQDNFYELITPGDFIVAGKNFGCGSSREHAPQLIKKAGIGGIIAKSFARIFYRNCINLGLPILICNTELINENDYLQVHFEKGIIVNTTSRMEITFSPYPEFIQKILAAGGAINYLKLHKKFSV